MGKERKQKDHSDDGRGMTRRQIAPPHAYRRPSCLALPPGGWPESSVRTRATDLEVAVRARDRWQKRAFGDVDGLAGRGGEVDKEELEEDGHARQ